MSPIFQSAWKKKQRKRARARHEKKRKNGHTKHEWKKGRTRVSMKNIEQPFSIGEICKKVKLNLKNLKMKCFWTFQFPKMKQNK